MNVNKSTDLALDSDSLYDLMGGVQNYYNNATVPDHATWRISNLSMAGKPVITFSWSEEE